MAHDPRVHGGGTCTVMAKQKTRGNSANGPTDLGAGSWWSTLIRAANAIWKVDEGRPFYWLRPVQLLITLVGVIAVALITVSLVVSGSLAHTVGSAIGVGDTGATVWNYGKFPVLLVIVSLIIS